VRSWCTVHSYGRPWFSVHVVEIKMTPSSCSAKVPAHEHRMRSKAGGHIEVARLGYRADSAFKECLDECPFPTLAYAYEISTW
jgi:hypothetical protein